MSLKAAIEGLAMAPIQTVDDPPLTSRMTLLAAIVSAAGFRWFPIPQPGSPGDAAAFSDITEMVPVHDGVTLRRTVTWLFAADDSFVIDGRPHSPGDLMAAIRDPETAARAEANPGLYIPTLSRAFHAGRDVMPPSQRIQEMIASATPGMFASVRAGFENVLEVYRGFCVKLQSKERHPKYGAPLSRSLRVRITEEKSVFVPYDLPPAERAAAIARQSALL